MNELRDIDVKRFPLTCVDDVVDLFRDQLTSGLEPNLTLLSIVLGVVEHSLTINRPIEKAPRGRPCDKVSLEGIDRDEKEKQSIPPVKLEDIRVLFEVFVRLVIDFVNIKGTPPKFTSSQLLKRVSDLLWNNLTKTFYKDKGHLQFLYTLFKEQKMDCFGMAFGVLSACQVLGLDDVHMCVSEDHVWAVHGDNGSLTSEITWHGKGTEDRRGQSISVTAPEKSWLYEEGMVCDRRIEVALLVVAINPVVNSVLESVEMAAIQKRILWILYDLKHLKNYPMALGVLADLEEILPTKDQYEDYNNTYPSSQKNSFNSGKSDNSLNKNHTNNKNNIFNNILTTNSNSNPTTTKMLRPTSHRLYREAVECSRRLYADLLIYPHTYLGNYHYRRRRYKEALRSWADAAQVASRYNYNREDDEIYREFHEIANEIIPNVIRACCTDSGVSTVSGTGFGKKGKIKKSKRYEDGNVTDLDSIETKSDTVTSTQSTVTNPVSTDSTIKSSTLLTPTATTTATATIKTTTFSNILGDSGCYGDILRFFDGICEWEEGSCMPVLHIIWANNMTFTVSKFQPLARSNLKIFTQVEEFEEDVKEEVEEKSRLGRKTGNLNRPEGANSMGKKGSGDEEDENEKVRTETNELMRDREVKNDSDKYKDQNTTLSKYKDSIGSDDTMEVNREEREEVVEDVRHDGMFTRLLLRSEKMVSMKDLLTSDRLNTSAIKLLLTAQSQVNSKSTSHLFNNKDSGGRVNNNVCGGVSRSSNGGGGVSRSSNGGGGVSRSSNGGGGRVNNGGGRASGVGGGSNAPPKKRVKVSEEG